MLQELCVSQSAVHCSQGLENDTQSALAVDFGILIFNVVYEIFNTTL